ncbi:MAG: DUF2271 domain-containing protein [Polyangiales bacterium]
MTPWQIMLGLEAPALLATLCAACLCACQASDAGRGVYFGDAPAVGAWRAAAPMGAAGGGVQNGSTGAAGMQGGPQTSTGAGTGGVTGSAMGAAGRPGTGGMLGTGGVFGTGGVLGVGGTTGVGGTVAAGGSSGAFSFDVVTVNQGGRFAPRNVGAIWIEDSSGKFVKTLKVWAATRARYLSKFGTDAMSNRLDAVTSATISQFGAQHATWNLTDVNRAAVPNGAYKVVIEVTDYDGTGQNASADFTLDGMPHSVTAPDQQYFTGMKIAVQ